jgi:hypothetical protein
MVYNSPLSVSFEALFLYRIVITAFYLSFNSYKVPVNITGVAFATGGAIGPVRPWSGRP